MPRHVAGLKAPAEIIVDRWGVAHIYARSERDAFFLQGYNAARDRLWQIDLWRKRGLGLLSASFGPAYAEQDRAARLLLYRGDMDREWAAYGPTARQEAEAFVAGINAYVGEIRAGVREPPVEFVLTRSEPDPWAAEDVVRIRSHSLTRNLVSEITRAEVASVGGLAADRVRQRLKPDIEPVAPEGLVLEPVPLEVLRTYRLGVQDVSFAAPAAPPADPGEDESNNWVIAPSRTATGRPILANDPHRALGAPSLRYLVHLNAPGLDVIGAGEPAMPGVSIGHNGEVAFGLTIFAVDQEDLYVYALNPDDPRQYRYGEGWEAMRIVRETLEVRDEAPREIELAFTRHGPVLHGDGERAYALRSVWWEPGTSAYFGSARYMRAQSWDDFRQAVEWWGAPSENLVYADTDGHIGWIAAGRAPIRPNWDGLLPVPGDGRYEWAGFRPQAELPHAVDPPAGWWASANEMNLPADYPARQRKVGFEWADRSRYQRIAEVLAANDKVSVADCEALQCDVHIAQSRRLSALIAPLAPADPRLAEALDRLRAWDGGAGTDSVAAAIYEVWVFKHLGRAVGKRLAPAAAISAGLPDAALDRLEQAPALFSPDFQAAREAILMESLVAALDELEERLGPDPEQWRWGRLHHVAWSPAAAALADPALKTQMDHGPFEAPGSGVSPNALAYRPEDFAVNHGASLRLVLDVGAWDESRAINAPGQSGDPAGPHYRDMMRPWLEGRYVPLLYSRAAIEAAAERVIRLTPAQLQPPIRLDV